MLEISFSESAQGGLLIAQRCPATGACGVVVVHEDGSLPTRAELRSFRRQAERADRRRRAEAIPLGGTTPQVFGFPLSLSVGPIAEDALGPERKAALTRLYDEQAAEDLMAHTAGEFRRLLAQLEQGESLRVWYSDQPDERCGLSWLCWELQCRGIQAPVHLVELPRWEVRSDGVVVQYTSWGEMEPGRYGAFLSRQQEAGPVLRSALAREWEQLRQENGPLRAVVNGRLCTVPAEFYDHALRRALAEQPVEFHQAKAIGLALGRYLPGISDCWLALRMENMLSSGELEAVTAAPADGPAYHRLLRKTAAFRAPDGLRKNFSSS